MALLPPEPNADLVDDAERRERIHRYAAITIGVARRRGRELGQRLVAAPIDGQLYEEIADFLVMTGVPALGAMAALERPDAVADTVTATPSTASRLRLVPPVSDGS